MQRHFSTLHTSHYHTVSHQIPKAPHAIRSLYVLGARTCYAVTITEHTIDDHGRGE